MGLSDKEIVALSGGHTLVNSHTNSSFLKCAFLKLNMHITHPLKSLFRARRMQIDQALMVLGQESPWSSTIRTLCKKLNKTCQLLIVVCLFSFTINTADKLTRYLLILAICRELLKGESEGLLKLPTDNALLEDSAFRSYVELYAKVIYVCRFLLEGIEVAHTSLISLWSFILEFWRFELACP